jgi:hypothetical protein
MRIILNSDVLHTKGLVLAKSGTSLLWGTACSERSLTGPSLTPAPSVSAPAPTIPPGPVSGKYLGTAPTALGYLNGVPMFQMELDLRQVDGAVTGRWGVVDFPDGGGAEGTVEGSTIALRLTSADSDYRIDGTLAAADGSAFSGTLGDCDTEGCSESSKPVAIPLRDNEGSASSKLDTATNQSSTGHVGAGHRPDWRSDERNDADSHARGMLRNDLTEVIATTPRDIPSYGAFGSSHRRRAVRSPARGFRRDAGLLSYRDVGSAR